MDIEYHYWVTGIIAHGAGFNDDEAQIIAYSSQYVDDNDVCFTVKDRITEKKYRNFVSQTMDILKPKDQLMRIYPIFHFVPGDPAHVLARRRDGKMHVLNTTPDSEHANALLSAAFKSADDVRSFWIGVATHAYVDTWAHQNFVGWHDSFNAVGVNVLPNIGHADAQHHPDLPCHRWDDTRLVDREVNNNHRFLSAAERLFSHYCDYLITQKRYTSESRPKWDGFEKELAAIFGSTCSGDTNVGKAGRLDKYKKLAPWLSEYDEKLWFNETVETKTRGLKDPCDGIKNKFYVFKDNYYWRDGTEYEKTKWYKFQQAVKEHERLALLELSGIFDQMGNDIRKV